MISSTALLLFSHGSLLCGSGRQLEVHADRLRQAGTYLAVEPGYLNYSTPSVEEAVKRCADTGATTIVIVPYFLVAGKFVTVDLPRRLESIVSQYPLINFVTARALEDSTFMQPAVEQVALSAHNPQQCQQNAMKDTRRYCEQRRDCPLYGSVICRTDGAKNLDNIAEVKNPELLQPVKALMLILHGSPRSEANDPARKLAEEMGRQNRFSKVIVAYLECNEPSIPDALDKCAGAGVTQVMAVPYFLHAGRHLVLDIPGLLMEGTARHPQMQIQMCDAVGTSPLIADAIIQRAAEALKG